MLGQRVGSYEIVRVLARGGMAVVYLAYQPALERHVALKRLDLANTDPTLAQRFVAEAHVVAGLDHPNIVTVYDFCEHGGVPYIAMEYVSGGSLRRHVGRLRLPQVIGVLDDMLSAMAHAARRGVTHRDLKPENVLVSPHGSVKIADFGIALAHENVARLTNTGTALGTPAYMSPEQAGGGAPPDPRTDLYSLGVIAYELLAGRLPFPDEGAPLALLYRHVHEPVPPLRATAPDAPPALAAWVEALLAKDPGQRPQPVEDVRRRLEEIAVGMLGPYWRRDAPLRPSGSDGESTDEEERTVAAPAAAGNAARRSTTDTTAGHAGARSVVGRARRRRAVAAAAGAAVVAAGAAALLLALPGDDAQPDRRPVARPSGPAAASAFDFAGDHRPASVAGLPAWTPAGAPARSGAVFVVGGSTALLAARRPQRGARFGAAVASGDFDRDGFADLAVGTPGARAEGRPGRPGSVTVVAGSRRGVDPEGARVLAGPENYLPDRGQRYGTALAAGDLDRDGYADLVVGAPGNDPFPVEEHGSGSISLHFGGAGGLRADRTRTLGRPRGGDVEFGRLVAIGDIDHDGHADVVEAARGHSAYCAGGPRGPTSCRSLEGGASALAIADLTGDRRSDLVEGVPEARDHVHVAGALRLRPGTPRGPARRAIVVTQNGPHIPGNAQDGDRFGAALTAGDLDRDGFADLLVGAPGEDGRAGRVTLVRGGARGYAVSGNRAFEQGDSGVPGEKRASHRFGAGMTLTRGAGAGRLDLAIAAPGAGREGTLWSLRDVTATFAAASTRRLSLATLRGEGGVMSLIPLAGAPGV